MTLTGHQPTYASLPLTVDPPQSATAEDFASTKECLLQDALLFNNYEHDHERLFHEAQDLQHVEPHRTGDRTHHGKHEDCAGPVEAQPSSAGVPMPWRPMGNAMAPNAWRHHPNHAGDHPEQRCADFVQHMHHSPAMLAQARLAQARLAQARLAETERPR